MKILLLDLYWLAGVLEGEGSFVWHKASRDPFGRPRIQLQMTDKDIMERVCSIMQTKLLGPYYSKQTKKDGSAKKETWYTHCSNNLAIDIMETILPIMGERRQSQILPLLNKWRTKV